MRILARNYTPVSHKADYSTTSNGSGVNAGNSNQPVSFFEVGADRVWLVDPDDTRVIYQGGTLNSTPMRLRYAIDTGMPIFPSRDSTRQLGEPFIIYHTTGVTRGIVVSYLNENDVTANECAR